MLFIVMIMVEEFAHLLLNLVFECIKMPPKSKLVSWEMWYKWPHVDLMVVTLFTPRLLLQLRLQSNFFFNQVILNPLNILNLIFKVFYFMLKMSFLVVISLKFFVHLLELMSKMAILECHVHYDGNQNESYVN